MFVSRSRLTLHPLLSLFGMSKHILETLRRNQLWCFGFLLEENRYNIPFVFRDWAPTSRGLGWRRRTLFCCCNIYFLTFGVEFGASLTWCCRYQFTHSLSVFWFLISSTCLLCKRSFVLVGKLKLHLSTTTHLSSFICLVSSTSLA